MILMVTESEQVPKPERMMAVWSKEN